MQYHPQEKRRSPALTIFLYTLLAIMTGVLAFLIGIYVGYFNIEVPTLAERLAPTPTPTRPAVLYIADGDTYFAEGKLRNAIDAYQKAIDLDPGNDIPFIRQSRLYVYTRDTAKAVERAEQAVLRNPTSPENLAYYCRALDWEAQYTEAFDACSCALEMEPDYAEAYAFLSEVYADQGDWFSAQETAQQAIDANFQSMDAHHNMGYALEVQGRNADAIKYYENAIKLAPKLAPNYVAAGRVYFWSGDFEAAADRFKRAIKLSPFDPEAYFHLGRTYYTEGDFIRAIDALEQSIGVDPTYVSLNPAGTSAWGYLGMSYYRRQNYESAIEFLPKAIQLAESKFLPRARQIEISTEVQSLTGPEFMPVLRGLFLKNESNTSAVAQLEPVTYVSGVDDEESDDDDLACVEAIVEAIQNKISVPGLQETELLTVTQTFSQVTGTATLDFVDEMLMLDIEDVPQPKTSPYEVTIRFWPNQLEQVGFVQPDADQKIHGRIEFSEKLQAPVDYYYTLGLAYTSMGLCRQAEPWLIVALERDSSAYNPAWYGIRQCPSITNIPPTPLPTFTPAPERGQ